MLNAMTELVDYILHYTLFWPREWEDILLQRLVTEFAERHAERQAARRLSTGT